MSSPDRRQKTASSEGAALTWGSAGMGRLQSHDQEPVDTKVRTRLVDHARKVLFMPSRGFLSQPLGLAQSRAFPGAARRWWHSDQPPLTSEGFALG